MGITVDVAELEAKVQRMYRAVAEHKEGSYHFEMGRALAEKLGYPAATLDRVPAGAVESFAGVGYFFDLVALGEGETVLDLGSGSGMDAFVAALQVAASGRVTGLDMTRAQLDKAQRLRVESCFENVEFVDGHIEDIPFADGTFDVVISNGVINLSPDKARVFVEAARVLRPGGRMAVADIVTRSRVPDRVVADTDLWASCIGGAAQQDVYQDDITSAGFTVESMRRNSYGFLSAQARNACAAYGVRSVSLLARRP